MYQTCPHQAFSADHAILGSLLSSLYESMHMSQAIMDLSSPVLHGVVVKAFEATSLDLKVSLAPAVDLLRHLNGKTSQQCTPSSSRAKWGFHLP
jgi:hypothetical protein